MDQVHIGIVGCGDIGLHHAERLRHIEGAVIQAAADSSENALRNMQNIFGIESGYTDFQRMIDRESIDAALVCVPTHLHKNVVLAAAQAGLSVFCQKPIARTVADAQQMIEVCRQHGVILAVGFVRRFDNYWGKAKEIVASGVLGKPLIWKDIHTGSGPRNTWFFDKDEGAGPLLDGMIHNIDFAHTMFGKAAQITSGLTRLKDSTAVDTGAVWIAYDSGNFMSNFWSWGLKEGVSGCQGTDIIGSDGVLIFPNGFSQEEIRGAFDEETQGAFLLVTEGRREPVIYQKNDMFLDEMIHFIDCVRSNGQPRATGEDGLAALEVALSVLGEDSYGR